MASCTLTCCRIIDVACEIVSSRESSAWVVAVVCFSVGVGLGKWVFVGAGRRGWQLGRSCGSFCIVVFLLCRNKTCLRTFKMKLLDQLCGRATCWVNAECLGDTQKYVIVEQTVLLEIVIAKSNLDSESSLETQIHMRRTLCNCVETKQ